MEKVDKSAHDELYKGRLSELATAKNTDEYVARYSAINLSPFYAGGTTKGYVRGKATRQLFHTSQLLGMNPSQTMVLDAGCGQGELSIYLACNGYNVIGVDISSVACANARKLAKKFKVDSRCQFLAESLERLSLDAGSVDFIIGHAALHHFIKYEGVAAELARVLKIGGEGYFADSFGENKTYHLFHDKEKMMRLGDVPLSKRSIYKFFGNYFAVTLTPMDWFTMLDKAYLRFLPKKFEWLIRRLSRIHFLVDRKIPGTSRLSLYLSGSVMATIKRSRL